MSPPKTKHTSFSRANACQYQLPDDDNYHCPHNQYKKGYRFCIFHIPKPYDEQQSTSADYLKLASTFEEHLTKWIYFDEGAGSFLDLRGFEFPPFEFEPRVFPKMANFNYAVFNGEVNFNVEIPKEKPESEWDTYEFTLLKRGATFASVHFKKDVGFGGCLVDEGLEFCEAVFEGKVVFGGTTISSCDFSDAVFNEEADFSHATIEYATFWNVKFKGVVDFSTFIGNERVDFSNTEFHKPTEFWRCYIGNRYVPSYKEVVPAAVSSDIESGGIKNSENKGLADIELSKRPHGVESSFSGAVFYETVRFYEMYFYTGVDFTGTTFRKRALFWAERGNLFSEGARFENVILPKDEELIFEQVDLSKTSFHDTFLDKIIFRDVVWGKATGRIRRFFRGNSFVLWDEVRPVEGMNDWLDDVKTAENYRQ